MPGLTYDSIKVYGRGVERWQRADIKQEFNVDFRNTGWKSSYIKVEIEGPVTEEYLEKNCGLKKSSTEGLHDCWHRLPEGTFTIKVWCNSQLVKNVIADFY